MTALLQDGDRGYAPGYGLVHIVDASLANVLEVMTREGDVAVLPRNAVRSLEDE